jgi:hypothetical protein
VSAGHEHVQADSDARELAGLFDTHTSEQR